METISSKKARQNFAQIIKRAEAGEWLSGLNTSVRAADALHLAAAFANRQAILTTDKTLAEAAQFLKISCELIQ